MRRVTFWAVVASPLLVMGAAFLIAGILELFAPNCVTYGNNPMGFDNETVCNQPGDFQGFAIWSGFILAVVLMPIALITGAVGAWRTRKRRSR